MPKNDPEYQKEYQRLYRERKKLEKLGIAGTVTKSHQEGDVRVIEAIDIKEVSIVHQVTSPEKKGKRPIIHSKPPTDRESGLPRSNYYSDHEAPGGWSDTIRNIDPHLAQKILDKIAPPRKLR